MKKKEKSNSIPARPSTPRHHQLSPCRSPRTCGGGSGRAQWTPWHIHSSARPCTGEQPPCGPQSSCLCQTSHGRRGPEPSEAAGSAGTLAPPVWQFLWPSAARGDAHGGPVRALKEIQQKLSLYLETQLPLLGIWEDTAQQQAHTALLMGLISKRSIELTLVVQG